MRQRLVRQREALERLARAAGAEDLLDRLAVRRERDVAVDDHGVTPVVLGEIGLERDLPATRDLSDLLYDCGLGMLARSSSSFH